VVGTLLAPATGGATIALGIAGGLPGEIDVVSGGAVDVGRSTSGMAVLDAGTLGIAMTGSAFVGGFNLNTVDLSAAAGGVSEQPSARIAARSAPAQNTLPDPAISSTRVELRAPWCAIAVASASISARSSALRASGRFSVSRTIPGAASDSIKISGMGHILKIPNRVSSDGALRTIASASASTRRVSIGSITPSSQSRALA
jgi:hypothetical protein